MSFLDFKEKYLAIRGRKITMKIKVLQWILLLFLLPADVLYLFGKNKAVIQADLQRLKEEIPYKKLGIVAFNYIMIINKPFRNIFYYRTRYSMVGRNISKIFFPPLKTIEILGEIAPGFRISHNYAVIHPERAGENLSVGQGVTIGKGTPAADGREYPLLGDNVSVYTNAVVFGGIRIGNNVRIGAGAVVNKDVPDDCTVVGNPGRIIKHESR